MKHLSVEQRYEISALLRAHHKKSDIAKLLGVHKSTITREIKRNNYMDLNLYVARYAQSKAESRARLRSSNYKKSVAQSVFDKARELIVEHQYSPEQVVGYCRRMGIRMCSHETLYKWIWRDKVARSICICDTVVVNTDHGKPSITVEDTCREQWT